MWTPLSYPAFGEDPATALARLLQSCMRWRMLFPRPPLMPWLTVPPRRVVCRLPCSMRTAASASDEAVANMPGAADAEGAGERVANDAAAARAKIEFLTGGF